MILIVDYGVGNIASLINMLDHIGYEARASLNAAEIRAASHVILPGIGAFDHAVAQLSERGLAEPVREAAGRGAQLLGVCLGMQLLGGASEEGSMAGLGLIDANVVRLPAESSDGGRLTVPHTGWAEVTAPRPSPIFPEPAEERFYFVHSYHMQCREPGAIAATVVRGGERVTVAVSRGNVHGVQFHPEKSHRYGMRLLERFAAL